MKPAVAGFLLFGRLNVFAFCDKPMANEYVFEYMKVRVLEMYSPLPRGAELSFAFHLQGFSPRNLKHMWTLLKHGRRRQLCATRRCTIALVSYRDLAGQKEPGGRDWYAAQSLEHGWFRNARAMQIDTHTYSRPGASITNFDARLPPPQRDLPH
ncbi:hypothetical protein [Burkholderia sp. PU8-34]